MSIEDLIKNKTAKQKADIKGQEIAKVDFRGEYTNSRLGIKVDIQSINVIDGGMEVFARAWKGGKPVGFGKDGTVEIERFRFINPPVLVSDVNGPIVRESVNENTGELRQRRYREDPAEAIRSELTHTISVVGKDGSNIVPNKKGSTVSTFLPAAGASTPCDGRTNFDGSGDSWSDVRNSTTSGNAQVDGTEHNIATAYFLTPEYGVYRVHYGFDISDISTDTISAAVFSVSGTGDAEADPDTTNIDIVSSAPASTDDLVVGDYDGIGSTVYADMALADWVQTDGTYNDFTLDATGITYVDGWKGASGIGFLAIRNSRDTDDSAPTGNNNVVSYFADQTGTNKDPKLVLTHAAAAAGPAKLKTWDTVAAASVKTGNTVAIANIKTINTVA